MAARILTDNSHYREGFARPDRPGRDGDGILVTVRRSKTNQDGETNDVRFVKDGGARAIRTLRAVTNPAPADRVVPLSAQMIGLRFPAAAQVAGVERRVTAHSGRVGLASELTSPGASTTDEPLGLPELLVTAGAASLFVLCCAGFLDRMPVLPLSDRKLKPAAAAAAGSSPLD